MDIKSGQRCSKFNKDVLKEKDSNGDFMSDWCIGGSKPDEAICTFCNDTINCKHHGSAAVRRHAKNAKHIRECGKHRNKDGILLKPTQKRIQFSQPAGAENYLSDADKALSAEIRFAVAIASEAIPYSFGDTATGLFSQMFPDSKIAKDFTASRVKVSYLISDGLGPYFKEKLLNEVRVSGAFYSIILDETPLSEKNLQQLDMLIRYYSNSSDKVIVNHLQSFHIGHGTAENIFQLFNDATEELPKDKLLCVMTDGPNVMKSLKAKIKSQYPDTLDLPTCSLHKVHNSFAKAMSVFGDEVETLLMDLFYFFKNSAAKSDDLKKLQLELGEQERNMLRHVTSRWLTLETSLSRFIDMFNLIKTFFEKNKDTASRDSARCKRIKQALSDKQLFPKALFLKNVCGLVNRFLSLFQSEAPLIHILYDEMMSLVKTLLGRFLNSSSFMELSGSQLKTLNVDNADNWKTSTTIDVGSDTISAMKDLKSSEKKTFFLGARSFYIECTKKLLKTLPFESGLLKHLQSLHPVMNNEESSLKSIKYLALAAPKVIGTEEVSLIQDEWTRLRGEPESEDMDSYIRIDMYWQKYFEMKDNFGNPKYPFITKLLKALMSIPHGSADVERGFSHNKNLLDSRSSLNEFSVNGLRQVKSYINRINGLENFKVDRETLRAARNAHKTYSARLEAKKIKEMTKKRESEAENEIHKLKTTESTLQIKLKAAQELLSTAEKNISNGIQKKNMNIIETGNILLSEAKTRINNNIEELEEVRKKIQQFIGPPSKKKKAT